MHVTHSLTEIMCCNTIQELANKSREAAKLAREAKKLEAIERSKQRQQNEDYFQQRQLANSELSLKKQQQVTAAHEPNVVEVEIDEDVTIAVEENDPFRITKKNKSKVFVR